MLELIGAVVVVLLIAAMLIGSGDYSDSFGGVSGDSCYSCLCI